MLCDNCCSDMHRAISLLQGKTVLKIVYECEGGDCDIQLKERLYNYYNQLTKKDPTLKNKTYYLNGQKADLDNL